VSLRPYIHTVDPLKWAPRRKRLPFTSHADLRPSPTHPPTKLSTPAICSGCWPAWATDSTPPLDCPPMAEAWPAGVCARAGEAGAAAQPPLSLLVYPGTGAGTFFRQGLRRIARLWQMPHETVRSRPRISGCERRPSQPFDEAREIMGQLATLDPNWSAQKWVADEGCAQRRTRASRRGGRMAGIGTGFPTTE
jgi:hypothetical protein